jgi:trk system potassium uptake protein TrkH
MPGSPLADADPLAARPRARSSRSAIANVSGASITVCAGGLLLAAVIDIVTGAENALILAVFALMAGVGGPALRRIAPMPARVPPRVALEAVVVSMLTMITISTIVYIATGTIERLDEAIFESTAGFSTTAQTVITNLESVDEGVLFWRVITQWIGGFAALATVMAVLPFLGVGGPQASEARPPQGAKHLFSAHMTSILRQYLLLYLGLTTIGAALLLIGGMGPFDAVTYAFTTISTGGFGNHDMSFAHFDSNLLEWMGAAGMFLGGLSLALIWRVIRGRAGSLWRSAELFAYVTLVAGATIIVTMTSGQEAAFVDRLRTSTFSVVSVVSTTGHWVDDWTLWNPGPQMLLLTLMGIGAMSGSMGGGFRIIRALALSSYVWRQLMRQFRPRSVRVVRVGQDVIDEGLVSRMIGYQVLYLAVAAAGLFGLTLVGVDLVSAISGSISALATFGPGLGELGPGTPLTGISHWGLLVMMVVMFAGRVELYPVLVVAANVLGWPFRAIGHAARALRRARTR